MASFRAKSFDTWFILISSQLCLVALVTFPITKSPYLSDDVFNTEVGRSFGGSWDSVFEYTTAINEFWISSAGRFFPLHIFHLFAVYRTFTTLESYKIAQWLAVLAMHLIICGLISAVTKSKKATAATGLVFLFLAYVLRDFYDPLMSYAFVIPTAVVLASIAVLLSYGIAIGRLRSLFWYLLVFASVAYAALMYEVVWASSLTVVVTLISASALRSGNFENSKPMNAGNDRWKRYGLAFLVVCFMLALGNKVMDLRSSASDIPTAYSSSWEPVSVVVTSAKQLSGLIPFSYYLFDSSVRFPNLIQTWWLVPLFAVLIYPTVKSLSATTNKSSDMMGQSESVVFPSLPKFFIASFFVAAIFPGIVVGSTKIWQQQELAFGRPYVANLHSVVTIGILAGIYFSRKNFPNFSRNQITFFSFISGFLLFFLFRSNWSVINVIVSQT